MRLLIIIVTGVFLVTYGWGWVVNVPSGTMDSLKYTKEYVRQAADQFQYALETVGKLAEFIQRPLERAKEPVV